MRKLAPIVAALAALLLAASCRSDVSKKRNTKSYAAPAAPANLPGIEFVKVHTSLFTFNETPAGRTVDGAAHPVEMIQHAFWISREPVPVSFYEGYMGKGKYPRNGLSYDDVNSLLDRAFLSTGLPLQLPTEAMFEAAMTEGAISPSESYDILVADGWSEESTQDDLLVDWEMPITYSYVVLRNRYRKEPIERYRARTLNRFYVAMRIPDDVDNVNDLAGKLADDTREHADGLEETFTMGGVSFKMLPVQGGQMTLGATPEQGKYAEQDEAPVHEVSLEDFKLAQTEVTAGLWNAVMGYYPVGNHKDTPAQPVTNVSWYDTMEFILKLREMTGRTFRLPTEDEWEYAARGGQRSRGTVFAGSNQSADVAVCTYKDRKGQYVRPHPADVASKNPNELGLYDMSGNAWEWVRGQHPDGGCVLRGGSRLSLNTACRVSNRQNATPGTKKDTFGFRLAL